MHPRHLTSAAVPGSPPVSDRTLSDVGLASAPASTGYSNGLLIWCLGALVLYVFYLQGGSLLQSRDVSVEGASRWSRLHVTKGGSSAVDSQVALLQELTAALDEAAAELEGSDRELRSLRASSAALPPRRGLGGGGVAAAASTAGAALAQPAAAPQAAAAPAAPPPVAHQPQPAAPPSNSELAETLSGLPFLPVDAAAAAALIQQQPCTACFRHGSGLATRLCLPAPCPFTPPAAARIISTSLYGDLPRYTWGALRNAELMPAVFPGWQLRVYTRSDMLPPEDVLQALTSLGAQVVQLSAGDKRAGFGMNWRFLVADDPTVEAFLCRDGDSRVSLRDRWAAEQWLSGREGGGALAPFHVVRDHPSHAGYKLMGGTWGALTSVFRAGGGVGSSLKSLLQEWVASKGHGDYGSDIDFLSVSLWPHMARLGVVQHDSHSCGASNHGVAGKPFPVPRAGTEHVGAVYVYEGSGSTGSAGSSDKPSERVREMDLVLLTANPAARGAADCIPLATPGAARRGLTLDQAFGEAEAVEVKDMAGAGLEGGSSSSSSASSSSGDTGAAFRATATAWGDVGAGSEEGGVCSQWWASSSAGGAGRVCRPALIHTTDAWVDGLLTAQQQHYSAVFSQHTHVWVGSLPLHPPPPPPLQYHERVPTHLEPIQALDGGVRYYSALGVVDPLYRAQGGAVSEAEAAAAATAFATQDLPRLLGSLVRPETVFLLPSRAAAVVGRVLQGMGEAGAVLAQHVAAQESAPSSLYWARHAYMMTCKCS